MTPRKNRSSTCRILEHLVHSTRELKAVKMQTFKLPRSFTSPEAATPMFARPCPRGTLNLSLPTLVYISSFFFLAATALISRTPVFFVCLASSASFFFVVFSISLFKSSIFF